jgi:hypothetical protein
VTLLRQLFFHPPSLHLSIYFLVYLMVLLIPDSYTILFWEFCFLRFYILNHRDQKYSKVLVVNNLLIIHRSYIHKKLMCVNNAVVEYGLLSRG